MDGFERIPGGVDWSSLCGTGRRHPIDLLEFELLEGRIDHRAYHGLPALFEFVGGEGGLGGGVNRGSSYSVKIRSGFRAGNTKCA